MNLLPTIPTVPVSAPTILALPAIPATVTATPAPDESSLPKNFHDAYKMKLSGRSVQEIADSFGVDRTTIYRWCCKVETEAQEQLANTPVFNIISQEVARLTDLEEQARQGAENTVSDRSKAMFLAEARRAAVARQNLLISVGIVPKAPEHIFRVTAEMRPGNIGEKPFDSMPRNEALEKLVDAMQRSRTLS